MPEWNPQRHERGEKLYQQGKKLRRPQHTVLDRIPDFLALDDRSRRLSRYRGLVQRFVSVGIKCLARGIVWLDTITEERRKEHSVRHLDASMQLAEIIAGGLRFYTFV